MPSPDQKGGVPEVSSEQQAKERVAVLEMRIVAVVDVLHHYVPFNADRERLEEMLAPDESEV